MDFVEVARMEEIDYKKVYLVVQRIKRNLEIETVFELERIGLDRICIENNIDFEDLTEAEKEEVWQELLSIAEEAEFRTYYAEIYNGRD